MNKKLQAIIKKLLRVIQSVVLLYPKHVKCNLCGWDGKHFVDSVWHKKINCPNCRSGIRQRLFWAALKHIEHVSLSKIIVGKNVLHFAPEKKLGSLISDHSLKYFTADYLREDCDYKLDMCEMPEIGKESFDVVIAFDVLEHVADYRMALSEIHRILTPNGYGIFTVPQKDNLSETYENEAVTTPEGRLEHFGQEDHLRIFGNDFPEHLKSAGFEVTAIDYLTFEEEIRLKYVLFPPALSDDPLATNYRKVFFCKKEEQ